MAMMGMSSVTNPRNIAKRSSLTINYGTVAALRSCTAGLRFGLILAIVALMSAIVVAQETTDEEFASAPGRYQPFVLKRDALLIGDHAFVWLPPKSPLGGRISEVVWAPSGRYCIAEVVPGEDELFKKDLAQALNEDRSEATRTVWLDTHKGTSAIMFEQLSSLSWLDVAWSTDGTTVYLHLPESDESDGRLISFRMGKAIANRRLPKGCESVAVEPATGGVAVYVEPPEEAAGAKVLILDDAGASHEITQVNGQTVAFVGVETFGERALVYWIAGPKGKGEHFQGEINFRTKQVVDPKKFESVADDGKTFGQLHYAFGNRADATGLTVSEVPTTKRPNPPSLLISAEVEEFWPSPADNAIAYSSQGILVIREIVKTTRTKYEELRLVAERAEKMNACKQIALSFLMYAGDNDDNLPTDNWQDAIRPYLKNDPLMEGFVFTLKGGNAGNIELPAETELGYMAIDGGRMVAFVDGHVEWKPDK